MSSWESTAASSVLASDSSMSRRALRFSASSLPAFIGGTFRGGFERVPILLASRERALPKFSPPFRSLARSLRDLASALHDQLIWDDSLV